MNKDWFTLIQKHTIPGARDKFETICGTLFKKIYPKNVRLVEVKQGDGGIDVLIGEIGLEPIHVIQCKFFPNNFGDSQKAQIRESFKTSIESSNYEMYKWTLCVFCTLNLKEHIWWASWKDNMVKKHNLPVDFINLIDGDDLIDLLNKNDLYNETFERLDSIKIDEIHKRLTTKTPLNDVLKSIQKASLFLTKIKNYFGKKPTTHIIRDETKSIVEWVKNDLIHTQKNILILEGDKGLGKSVILKDVYEELINEDYIVLGIKADKYYAKTPRDLENKLFLNEEISFLKIIEVINFYKKKFIVIIDQLDALSQTLSSSREYLQTYNRVINELINEENVRIIISSRTYDLKYDADLSTYKSHEYKNIKTTLLSENQVKSTLNKFDISCSIKKFIELLRTPNHLEIFCKLPNKNKINLNALSSLKDLYDELWNTLISNQKNLLLDKVVYKIAIEMYNQQQIVVKKQFIINSHDELNYLFSNQLLTIEENHIQFFHQTFYDYCFARQFVENGNDISIYLNQNQQNLEIRSIIKMVFEYLREYDHKKYVKYTKNILISNKYRFHVKSLIINNLGVVDPTIDEKELLHDHILNNKEYEEIFIHSVFSKKWIEYLLNLKIIDEYLFIEKKYSNSYYDFYNKQSFLKFQFFEKLNFNKIVENKKNAIWSLCRSNINKAPTQIITYLDSLPNFPDKHNFIERIIYNLDNWEDEKMLVYFEKYFPFVEEVNNRDNFWYYQTLEKILNTNLNYVLEKAKPIFIKRFNNRDSWYSIDFSHEQEGLIKKMYSKSSEESFLFLLGIYSEVIENNKRTEFYEKIDSPYYGCTRFYDGVSASKEGHIFIQEFLVEHLISKKMNIEYISSFYNKYKNSNSIHHLRLLALFFNDAKEKYINKIFEFIRIIHSKNGFNSIDDLFQLHLRQLIGNSFILFSEIQKNILIEILLSIKYPYDLRGWKYKDANGSEKVNFSGYGIKQFLFLLSLPLEEINKKNRLKKVFQEFKRKFGEVDPNIARNLSSGGSYTVGAPLELKAYTNMNLESWKTSILKFNDYYKEGHGPKGGKREHSRAFKDAVIKKPDIFFGFIIQLFEDKKVSIDYLSSGIDGLIEAEFTPEKVKILYKKLINLNLDKTHTLYTIWKTDYLISNKLIDNEIILFLTNNAINHPNPDKVLNKGNALSDSLNSVRASAIRKIIRCYEYKEYSELIFKTVEKAVYDTQISIRVAIITEIAYLNHLDLDRSFKIFMELVESENIELLKNSINASQYFNHKFHNKMLGYFNKIINNKELHENGQVIIISWLNEKINDKKLFEKFIKSSKEAKLCAFKIAEANLLDKNGEVDVKCLNILNRFLKQKDKEFSSSYSGLILRKINNNNNFKLFYPFLNKYSKTNLLKDEPRYFLVLLLNCAKDYPVKCLNLIENMNFEKTPNIQERGNYGEEPIQLILAIYSKLNMDLKNNRKNVVKALNIFDSMLKQNHLRVPANNAIELTL